jgi:hypothetical protein
MRAPKIVLTSTLIEFYALFHSLLKLLIIHALVDPPRINHLEPIEISSGGALQLINEQEGNERCDPFAIIAALC